MTRRPTSPVLDLRATILAAWRTNGRVTAWLVEQLPADLWDASVPGAPRKTGRSLLAHLHNARSRWIRTLGEEHGIVPPPLVNPRTVTRRSLLAALRKSARGIESVPELGLANGGRVPPSEVYAWRNLPLDVGHVLTYFVAHEAHHRGQIVLMARQVGRPLPREVSGELWQWTRRGRFADTPASSRILLRRPGPRDSVWQQSEPPIPASSPFRGSVAACPGRDTVSPSPPESTWAPFRGVVI